MLAVRVTEDVTAVKFGSSSVNCVLGGSSDPIVVHTTVVPFGTLSVSLAEKPVAEGADAGTPSDSKGVTDFGSAVDFTADTLEGYVYLKCADVETFNETSATVVVNLDGTSNHSYSL